MTILKQFTAVLALFWTLSVQAQNHQKTIDSLEKSLLFMNNDTIKVNTLNAISEQLWDIDQYDSAMDFAISAKGLAEKLQYQIGISKSLISEGRVYIATGAYPQALDRFFQSLKISEAQNDTLGTFISLTNIGTIYYQQQNYSTALEYYLEVLKTKMERETAYNSIGNIYYRKGEYSLCMQYYIKALNEARKNNNISVMADIYSDIASVCEDRKDFTGALEWYFRALPIKQELNDNVSMSSLMGGIGDIYMAQRKFTDALYYENQSLKIAREIGNLLNIRETEKSISEIYEQTGNCEKAFEHHKKYIEIKDSILNKENIQKTTRSLMIYEFDKKQTMQKAEQDKKDAIKEQEVKQQRIEKYAFIIGFLLVLIFSFFLLRSFKIAQKAKKLAEEQKALVVEKNKEITDSIHYTKRLQDATLPPLKLIKECFPESFLYSSAKDIVAGDFYFLEKDKNGNICFAVADSTGHGLPGSMVSIVNSKALYQSVKEFGLTDTGEILDKTTKLVQQTFEKSEGKIKDGMDISIGCIHENTLNWSGANNPIWIIRNNEIIEYKGDSQPVGNFDNRKPFTSHKIELIKGDVLYLFTDGICDQFSQAGKKFLKKRLREILLSICNKPMDEQYEIIYKTMNEWRGSEEQTDDQTMLGIRI